MLIGYTYISAEAVNRHLNFIPSNAKAVVIIDSKYLANDYYELLKFNPTKIDEVLNPIETEDETNIYIELPGIVPLEKMTFYIYQDIETKDQQFFRCFIATLSDESQFLSRMNGMAEEAIITQAEGGNIHFYKEDNKLVLIKNDLAVVVEPINSAFKLSSSIGERHYFSVFSNDSKPLINESISFKETVNQKNHVNLWSANEAGILESFSGSRIGFDKLFKSQIISVNLKDKGLETKFHLYNNEKDLIIEKSNEVIALNEEELVRLSISLNSEKLRGYFHSLMPSDKRFLLDGWTGQVCTSIVGFRNKPVYKVKLDTIIDSIKLDTLIKVDTVELSRLANLPEFVLGIELKNAKTIGELLITDSTISAKDGYFFSKIPNLINENIYMKIVGNSLILSSSPLEFKYEPVYSTFTFNMNIEGLISNYPPKDMLQALLIPTINKFDFKSFELYYEMMNDDFICLNGKLKLGKEDIHSLLKVIPFAFNMASDF